MQKKAKKVLKKSPMEVWRNQISEYKFHRVGIIKGVKFGKSAGTRFGAFAYMMDGPVGLQLKIIEETSGFPVARTIEIKECQSFLTEFGVNYHNELIGKPVLILSNSEAVNGAEKVIPHKMLLEAWKK